MKLMGGEVCTFNGCSLTVTFGSMTRAITRRQKEFFVANVDRHVFDAKERQHNLLRGARESATSVDLSFFGSTCLPLVVQPRTPGLNLVMWAGENGIFIKEQLNHFGGILFRGFDVDHNSFDGFISRTSSGALAYTERSSPRTKVKGNIYTSTDYPAEYPIFLHNEQSYNTTFPRKIYFMCVVPPETSGATPIADVRKVFTRLNPSTRHSFQRRRYAYVRNMGGEIGMHWKDVFQTQDRTVVEKYCEENNISPEWIGDDQLKTRQIRDVIARHPETGEFCWFNHLTFFNVASLPLEVSELLLETLGEHGLPNNTFYGDGAPIEQSVMEELHSAYKSESVSFPWKANDVLMLDNMLIAHGRETFSGKRCVITGLADLCNWRTVQVVDSE